MLASTELIRTGVEAARNAAVASWPRSCCLRVFVEPIADDHHQRRANSARLSTEPREHSLLFSFCQAWTGSCLGIDRTFDVERILADVRTVMHTDEVLATRRQFRRFAGRAGT